MGNELIKTAAAKYFTIKETMRQQEEESAQSDPDGFGSGCDSDLYQQLHEARQELMNLISPEEYFSLKDEVSHLKEGFGQLILENIALKGEVKRLGGDPDFIGNVHVVNGAQ